MPIKSYKEAINEAIAQEMKKDENVILIGEDVAGGAGTNGEQDAWGGVMGVTKGLLGQFGRERIIWKERWHLRGQRRLHAHCRFK